MSDKCPHIDRLNVELEHNRTDINKITHDKEKCSEKVTDELSKLRDELSKLRDNIGTLTTGLKVMEYKSSISGAIAGAIPGALTALIVWFR